MTTGLTKGQFRRGLLELVAAEALRARQDLSLDEALELLERELDIQCFLLSKPYKSFLRIAERRLTEHAPDLSSPQRTLTTAIDTLRAGDQITQRSSGFLYTPDWLARSLAALTVADLPLLCLDCGDSALVPQLLLRRSLSEQGQIDFTTVDASPEIVGDLRLLASLVIDDLEQVRESVLLDERKDRWRRWADDSSRLPDALEPSLGGRKFGTILVNLFSPIYSQPRQRAQLNELLPITLSQSLTSDGRAILLGPATLLDGYTWSAFRESAQQELHVEAIAELGLGDELSVDVSPMNLVLIILRQRRLAITRSFTDFASRGSAYPSLEPENLLDDLVIRLHRREWDLPVQEGVVFERPTSELMPDRWDSKFYSPARLALQDELISKPGATWLGGVTQFIRRGPFRHVLIPYIETQVADVTFESRQEAIGRLKVGDQLLLRREPDHPEVPNAVHVERRSGTNLGYLPTELAEEIAEALDELGGAQWATVTQIEGATDGAPSLSVTIRFVPPQYAKVGEPVSVVRPRDVINNRLEGSGETAWLLNERRTQVTRLETGDILLLLRGFQKACLVPREFEGALCHQDFAIVRPNDDVDPMYLLSYILSPQFQQQLHFVARGRPVPMIHVGDLEDLLVIVPPLRTQRRFALAFAESQGELGTGIKDGWQVSLGYDTEVDFATAQQLTFTNVLGNLFSDWDQIHTLDDWLRLKGEIVRDLRNLITDGRSPFGDAELEKALVALDELNRAINRTRSQLRLPVAGSRHARRALTQFRDRARRVGESYVRGRLSGLAGRLAELLESESAPFPLQLSLEETVLPAGVPALVRLVVVNEGHEALNELEIVPRFSAGEIVERPPWRLHSVGPNEAQMFEARVRFDTPERVRVILNVSYIEKDGLSVRRTIQLTVDVIPVEEVPFTPIHPNPYITGGAVDTPEMFFGRQDVLEFLKTNLIGTHQSNVIILQGNRRTGKSSILKQVVNRDLFAPHIPVFIDCQGLGRLTDQRFFYKLAREVWKALAKRQNIDAPPRVKRTDVSTEDAFYDFQDVLDRLFAGIPNRRVVLLIDEFEVIDRAIQEGDLKPIVLENLRHLFQHRHDLAVVLTGSYRLTQLRQEYWSILFGLGLKRDIGFLDEPSTRRLITQPLADVVTFSEQGVDRIIELTACQPYFVQMVCHNVVNVLNTRGTTYVAQSYVEEAAQETLISADGHMRFMFESARSRLKQAILVFMAHNLSEPGALPIRDIEQFVERNRLSLSRAGLQEALREFADRDIVNIQGVMGRRLYGFNIDLVRQWIRRNYDLRSAIALAEDASYIREG
jgi:hypothetical protein